MSIKLVLFDIGGVFFTWKDRWLFSDVAKRFSLSEMALTDECKKVFPALRRGRISEQEMWQKVGKEINVDVLSNVKDSLIHDFFKSRIVVDHNVLDVAEQLQKNGIHTRILSNTTAVMHSVVKELVDMKHFVHQFLSYEIGMEKPDECIFKYVMDKIPLIKEEVMFVDDRQSNIDAAKDFGMNTMHFVDSFKFVKDLRNLKIL